MKNSAKQTNMSVEVCKKIKELENANKKLRFCAIALIIFNIALVASNGCYVLFCIFLTAWFVTIVFWFVFLIKCIKYMRELYKMKGE